MKLNSSVTIAGKEYTDKSPPYIIGEVACAHQGDLEIAKLLIDAVVKSGADCVQLQIFNPAANMVPSSKLYKTLEKLKFSPSQWKYLVDYVRSLKIDLSLFIYDEPSLDLAANFQPDLIKLNSSELSNPKILEGAAKFGVPMTLGTGSSTYSEIKAAIKFVLDCGQKDLILMHGIQNFPTKLENLNINRISKLKRDFGGLIIYADHTDPNLELCSWIDLLAIGRGATFLEKHIILKREADKVDSEAALEPQEFERYVRNIRIANLALGLDDFDHLTAADLKYRKFQKKSIVAAQDLTKGTIIQQKHVKYLRVQSDEEGIAPIDFPKTVEGKKLKCHKRQFQQLFIDDLK